MATNPSSKDTIYVDVDDEITTIIDKVNSSDGRVVALVLPKRATVFQSIVNMKLLKRSAETAKKHPVLITTETSLMPLAATVGLYVAATPQSKPEIPSLAEPVADADEVVDETATLADEPGSGEYTADNAGERTVGELAASSNAAPTGADSAIETLNMPDNDEDPGKTAADAKPSKKKDKANKGKHPKVPNFNKFRMRLALGILIIIIIVFGLYLCLAVLPKATIAISTNASDVNVSLTMTLDTSAGSLNTANDTVPAKTEQQQKTTTQQVPTTGQKNNGTAATGSMTMSAGSCSGNIPDDVPAGTGVSANSLTYITQGDTSFGASLSHGKCTWQSNGPTSITAQNPGSKYNTNGSADFAVAGRSDITGTGSASGGTDSIIQVVAQADIDGAKQKLASQSTSAVKTSLEQALSRDGLYPITATFSAGTPIITSSSNVGDQASNVTVTQAITYTMFGAKKSNLETLLKSNIDSQINTSNQSILNDGLSSAKIGVVNTSGGQDQISLQTTGLVGPDINAADIKKLAVGKKSGDVKSAINNQPGVTGVNVKLSPFWVTSVPKNTSKITVTIGKAKQSSNGG